MKPAIFLGWWMICVLFPCLNRENWFFNEAWPTLLSGLRAEVAVMESSLSIAPPEGWMVTKERRYGGTLVTVAHRSGSEDAPDSGTGSGTDA